MSKNAFHFKKVFTVLTGTRITTEMAIKDVKLKTLIESDENFDIVIIQAMCPLSFAVAAKFNVPIIGKWNMFLENSTIQSQKIYQLNLEILF